MVPDPDLEIKGRWGGGVLQENFFGPFGLKTRGGGPPLDQPLQSHDQNSNCNIALTQAPEGKRKQRLLGGTQLKKRERKRAGIR